MAPATARAGPWPVLADRHLAGLRVLLLSPETVLSQLSHRPRVRSVAAALPAAAAPASASAAGEASPTK